MEEFKQTILEALKDKPKNWRNGQFVFNYIDAKYGVARTVQFARGIDCFYRDEYIDDFINASYEELMKIQNNF